MEIKWTDYQCYAHWNKGTFLYITTLKHRCFEKHNLTRIFFRNIKNQRVEFLHQIFKDYKFWIREIEKQKRKMIPETDGKKTWAFEVSLKKPLREVESLRCTGPRKRLIEIK